RAAQVGGVNLFVLVWVGLLHHGTREEPFHLGHLFVRLRVEQRLFYRHFLFLPVGSLERKEDIHFGALSSLLDRTDDRLARLEAQVFQGFVNRAGLYVDGDDGFVSFLSFGEGPAGDDFDGVDFLVAGIVDFARRDLGVDGNRAVLFIHDDAGGRFIVGRYDQG